MTDESLNALQSRSWRDIPQPVKPRAMSSGGRWRLTWMLARATGVVLLVGALAWGTWHVAAAFRGNAKAMPAAAKGVPIKRVDLQTANGGVLDDAWLARTLALPKGVSLMEVDLERLRARVLADEQVLTATVTRQFPDCLKVQISERSPVARVKVSTALHDQVFLVARDGIVYGGSNYDPAMLDTLPWLAGFSLKARGAGFQPIPNMQAVADLLARAQNEATHLYLTWQIVSLDDLELDGEIEVTTKTGSRIVFTAKTDFFPQLAKLDHILGKLEQLRDPNLANAAPVRAEINLTLGAEVPVMIKPVAAQTNTASPATVAPALAPGFNLFPRPIPKHPREL